MVFKSYQIYVLMITLITTYHKCGPISTTRRLGFDKAIFSSFEVLTSLQNYIILLSRTRNIQGVAIDSPPPPQKCSSPKNDSKSHFPMFLTFLFSLFRTFLMWFSLVTFPPIRRVSSVNSW